MNGVKGATDARRAGRAAAEHGGQWKPVLPSVIAVLAAILMSIFVIERTTVILSCLVVGVFALSFAVAGCIRAKRSRWRWLSVTILPAVLYVVIAGLHIPLRIVFRICRPEFDRAAALIEAGTPPATPFWIGPFKIRMVGRGRRPGTPYLARNEAGDIDGFVRHPDGRGYNLWSCITLDDAWSHIQED